MVSWIGAGPPGASSAAPSALCAPGRGGCGADPYFLSLMAALCRVAAVSDVSWRRAWCRARQSSNTGF
eukprot:5238910-Pyramimonas_sp.AAC.1